MYALLILVMLNAQSCLSLTPPFALSATHRAYLQAETLAPVLHVRELPVTVREALRSELKEPVLLMAEPGAAFQQTDFMLTPGLLSRRLIAAGCSPDHCLVHYEQGGHSHTFHVVLFGFVGKDAVFEWAGLASQRTRDVTELKALVLRSRRRTMR